VLAFALILLLLASFSRRAKGFLAIKCSCFCLGVPARGVIGMGLLFPVLKSLWKEASVRKPVSRVPVLELS